MRRHLVIELPVLVGTEERRPDLRHRVFRDHLKARLQRVVNLDLALVCVHLNATSTGSKTGVKPQYQSFQVLYHLSLVLTILETERSRYQP